VGIVLLW